MKWGTLPRQGQSNVEIGVIPMDAPVDEVSLHCFQLYDSRLVAIGLEHSTITATDPEDVAQYRALIRHAIRGGGVR